MDGKEREEESNTKRKDIHGTVGTTRWVHSHRRVAKWLMKIAVAGAASFLYYLRKQEKQIEEEEKKRK